METRSLTEEKFIEIGFSDLVDIYNAEDLNDLPDTTDVLRATSYSKYSTLYQGGKRGPSVPPVVMEPMPLNEIFVRDMYSSLMGVRAATLKNGGPFGKNVDGYISAITRIENVTKRTFGLIPTVEQIGTFNDNHRGPLLDAFARFLLNSFIGIYLPIYNAFADGHGPGKMFEDLKTFNTQNSVKNAIMEKYKFFLSTEILEEKPKLQIDTKYSKTPSWSSISSQGNSRSTQRSQAVTPRSQVYTPKHDGSRPVSRQSGTFSTSSVSAIPYNNNAEYVDPFVNYNGTHFSEPDMDEFLIRNTIKTQIATPATPMTPMNKKQNDALASQIGRWVSNMSVMKIRYERDGIPIKSYCQEQIDTESYHRCDLHSHAGSKNFPRLSAERLSAFNGTYGYLTRNMVCYDSCYRFITPPVEENEFQKIQSCSKIFGDLIKTFDDDVETFISKTRECDATTTQLKKAHDERNTDNRNMSEYVNAATASEILRVFKNPIFKTEMVRKVTGRGKKSIVEQKFMDPNVFEHKMLSSAFGLEEDLFRETEIHSMNVNVGSIFGEYDPESGARFFKSSLATNIPSAILEIIEPNMLYRFKLIVKSDGKNIFSTLTTAELEKLHALADVEMSEKFIAYMENVNFQYDDLYNLLQRYAGLKLDIQDLMETKNQVQPEIRRLNEIEEPTAQDAKDLAEFLTEFQGLESDIKVYNARLDSVNRIVKYFANHRRFELEQNTWDDMQPVVAEILETIPQLLYDETVLSNARENCEEIIQRFTAALIKSRSVTLNVTSLSGTVDQSFEIDKLVYENITKNIPVVDLLMSCGVIIAEVTPNIRIHDVKDKGMPYDSYENICYGIGKAFLQSNHIGSLQNIDFVGSFVDSKKQKAKNVTIKSKLAFYPWQHCTALGAVLTGINSNSFNSLLTVKHEISSVNLATHYVQYVPEMDSMTCASLECNYSNHWKKCLIASILLGSPNSCPRNYLLDFEKMHLTRLSNRENKLVDYEIVRSKPAIYDKVSVLTKIDRFIITSRYQALRAKGHWLFDELFKSYTYGRLSEEFYATREMKRQLEKAKKIIDSRINAIHEIQSLKSKIVAATQNVSLSTFNSFVETMTQMTFFEVFDEEHTFTNAGLPTTNVPLVMNMGNLYENEEYEYFDYENIEILDAEILNSILMMFDVSEPGMSYADTFDCFPSLMKIANRDDAVPVIVNHLCVISFLSALIRRIAEEGAEITKFCEMLESICEAFTRTFGINREVKREIFQALNEPVISESLSGTQSGILEATIKLMTEQLVEYYLQKKNVDISDKLAVVSESIRNLKLHELVKIRYDRYCKFIQMMAGDILSRKYSSEVIEDNSIELTKLEDSVKIVPVMNSEDFVADIMSRLSRFKYMLEQNSTLNVKSSNMYGLTVYEKKIIYDNLMKYIGNDFTADRVYTVLALYVLNNMQDIFDAQYLKSYTADRKIGDIDYEKDASSEEKGHRYIRSAQQSDNYTELFGSADNRNDLITKRDNFFEFSKELHELQQKLASSEKKFVDMSKKLMIERDDCKKYKRSIISRFVNSSCVVSTILAVYKPIKNKNTELSATLSKLERDSKLHISKIKSLKIEDLDIDLKFAEMNPMFYAVRKQLYSTIQPESILEFNRMFQLATNSILNDPLFKLKTSTDIYAFTETFLDSITSSLQHIDERCDIRLDYSSNLRLAKSNKTDIAVAFIKKNIIMFLNDIYEDIYSMKMNTELKPIVLSEVISRTKDMNYFNGIINSIGNAHITDIKINSGYLFSYSNMANTIRDFIVCVIESLQLIDQGPGFHFIINLLGEITKVKNFNINAVREYKRRLLNFIPDILSLANVSKFNIFVSILNGTFEHEVFADFKKRMGCDSKSKIFNPEYEQHRNVNTDAMKKIFKLIDSIGQKSTYESIHETLEWLGISTELIKSVQMSFYQFSDEYVGITKTGDFVIINDDLVLTLREKYRLFTRGECYGRLYRELNRFLVMEINNQNRSVFRDILETYFEYFNNIALSFESYSEAESFFIKR